MTPDTAPSILVVEDERIVCKDLQQTLKAFGYDASRSAASSEQAIARADEHRPDLVLMDIRIKGERDGIDTASILRERFDVPVIYLTAHADETTIERAKHTHPYGYLVKPIKATELRSAIEVALFRHDMEVRLREREQWMSTTLRSIADAVVSVDTSGRITFMNPAAEALLGRPANDAVGRPAAEVIRLVDAELRPLADTPVDLVLREGRAIQIPQTSLLRDDGATRIISDSAAPVVDDDRTLGVVMVFSDVTERARLQERLERADRLAALGTVAAGVAHELNNPLSNVMGNSEHVEAELLELKQRLATVRSGESTLEDDDEDALDDAIGAVRDLQESATRIASIVADIRSFVRPAPTSAGLADLSKAMQWALNATVHEFRERAQLVRDLGPTPLVAAEQAKLEQVFINLLINAAQVFEPGHAADNEVTVTTRTDASGRAVVEIRDTGAGIPAAVLDRIFEPFYTTKPADVGTGLGLAICHGIVTSFGGTIEVESEVGVGTRFRVLLPGARAQEERAIEPSQALVKERRSGRILVMDDDELVLSVIHRILGADHELTCVTSARQGLRLLERGEHFNVTLCDLMMPDMSGLDFYDEVARRDPNDARRIVFVTAGVTSEEFDERLRAIANRCVHKPFKASQLRDTIQQLLANP